MSEWRLVRLQFGQCLVHFGELGIGMEETSERVRSDTLFSAWITAYARLHGKTAVEDLLSELKTTPFRLSSTYVYRTVEDQVIDYLPRLIELPRNYPPVGQDLKFAKVFRKLAYLPLEIWQRWYQLDGFSESDRLDLEDKAERSTDDAGGALRQAGLFDYGDAFKPHQIPKVAIDRTTRATNFYQIGFVQFNSAAQAGLYFLIQFPGLNSVLESNLRAALEFLGEEGLGGERSSGAGRFEAEWHNLTEPQLARWRSVVEFDQPNAYGLISLFWQKDLPPELINERTKYTIQPRRGWMASASGRQLRRKTVQMFAEGSIFPVAPGGELANVTPDRFDPTRPNHHPIYRSGISLSLPVRLTSSPSIT